MKAVSKTCVVTMLLTAMLLAVLSASCGGRRITPASVNPQSVTAPPPVSPQAGGEEASPTDESGPPSAELSEDAGKLAPPVDDDDASGDEGSPPATPSDDNKGDDDGSGEEGEGSGTLPPASTFTLEEFNIGIGELPVSGSVTVAPGGSPQSAPNVGGGISGDPPPEWDGSQEAIWEDPETGYRYVIVEGFVKIIIVLEPGRGDAIWQDLFRRGWGFLGMVAEWPAPGKKAIDMRLPAGMTFEEAHEWLLEEFAEVERVRPWIKEKLPSDFLRNQGGEWNPPPWGPVYVERWRDEKMNGFFVIPIWEGFASINISGQYWYNGSNGDDGNVDDAMARMRRRWVIQDMQRRGFEFAFLFSIMGVVEAKLPPGMTFAEAYIRLPKEYPGWIGYMEPWDLGTLP